MSTKTFFLNLAIDASWLSPEERRVLYPGNNPRNTELLNAFQFLGVYRAGRQDRVICYRKPDAGFLRELEANLGFIPDLYEVPVDPTVEGNQSEWFDRARSAFIESRFVRFSSISPLEEQIQRLRSFVDVQPSGPSSFYSELNLKRQLVAWAQQGNLPFPRTEGPMPLSEALARNDLPVLKFDQSGGSAGVFFLDDDVRESLKVLDDAPVFLQEQLKIERHVYTCADVRHGRTTLVGHFELLFKNGVSIGHLPLGDFRNELNAAAFSLGERLAERGYSGPFGFDGVYAGGVLYPAIDLNVRLCKARLLLDAMEAIKLSGRCVFRHVAQSSEPFVFDHYAEGLPGLSQLLYWDNIALPNGKFLLHALICCPLESRADVEALFMSS